MFEKQVKKLNGILKEKFEENKLKHLVEKEISIKDIHVLKISYKYRDGENGHEGFDELNYHLQVSFDDSILMMVAKTIHYDDYSVEFDEEVFDDKYFDYYFGEDSIDVRHTFDWDVREKDTAEVKLREIVLGLLTDMKLPEIVHEETKIHSEVYKEYKERKINQLKEGFNKHFSFIGEIIDLYAEQNIAWVKCPNGATLELKYSQLLHQINELDIAKDKA